ncbi:ion transporter [Marinobacterium aestuariivivens]|uniref:Ion transporter n=1 Tax=Marinobacterium aestuariivivens TaxID=1698799 RepID=A0ABW2A827_9GAMM
MKPENLLDRPLIVGVTLFLILYSVVCFSIDTLPDLRPAVRRFLDISETVVVGLFTLEYLYRIYSTENRLRFVFSFYGLVDLLAILPFYLATSVDLRTLRLLRLLRLGRVLKLLRYRLAFDRFAKAIAMAKEELLVFTLGSLVVLFLAAVGIYYFEHAAQPDKFRSIFDSLWWVVVTLTTVGYGDIYPITLGGRLFTFCVLMIGLGLVAVPTGIIASSLSAIRAKQEEIASSLSSDD